MKESRSDENVHNRNERKLNNQLQMWKHALLWKCTVRTSNPSSNILKQTAKGYFAIIINMKHWIDTVYMAIIFHLDGLI